MVDQLTGTFKTNVPLSLKATHLLMDGWMDGWVKEIHLENSNNQLLNTIDLPARSRLALAVAICLTLWGFRAIFIYWPVAGPVQ